MRTQVSPWSTKYLLHHVRPGAQCAPVAPFPPSSLSPLGKTPSLPDAPLHASLHCIPSPLLPSLTPRSPSRPSLAYPFCPPSPRLPPPLPCPLSPPSTKRASTKREPTERALTKRPRRANGRRRHSVDTTGVGGSCANKTGFRRADTLSCCAACRPERGPDLRRRAFRTCVLRHRGSNVRHVDWRMTRTANRTSKFVFCDVWLEALKQRSGRSRIVTDLMLRPKSFAPNHLSCEAPPTIFPKIKPDSLARSGPRAFP